MPPSNIAFSFSQAQLNQLLAAIKGNAPSLTAPQAAAVQLLLPAPQLLSPASYETVQAYQAAVYAAARANGTLVDTGWQSNPAANLLAAMVQANFSTFYGNPLSVEQALAANSAQPGA